MASLPIFTPSLAPYEGLEALFVVRNELLEGIVQRVREASGSPARNHTLLVGPRGSGKTHLISLAYHRARRLLVEGSISVQLSWLPEDPWTISSYRRLLEAILHHLEPRVESASTVEELEAVLTQLSGTRGVVVCFLENLDQVLHGIGNDGQQRLRHLAQQRVILFVASTTTLSRDLANQPSPFYGFFTTTLLKPFDVEQARSMLKKIAEHRWDDQLAAYLESDKALGRLRAVAHLAGGQPRIWALFAGALTKDGLEQLVAEFLTRFDDLTPYYQEQLARLSPQQREVVVTMADLDHPANVKELAEATGIDQRTLSKTMVDLRERGWVAETQSQLARLLDRRRTYYELGEPLVRLAFQLKASRGTPIELVVEFLKHWFEPSDLGREVAGLSKLAQMYLWQASDAQRRDPVFALIRRLRGDAATKQSLLDLLGRFDDACAALGSGDPERLLQMPSALRGIVDTLLLDDIGDNRRIRDLRIKLHEFALEEVEYLPRSLADRWAERAAGLLGLERDSRALSLLVRWLGRGGRFDEARLLAAEVSSDDSASFIVSTKVSAMWLDLALQYSEAELASECLSALECGQLWSERVVSLAIGSFGIDDPVTVVLRQTRTVIKTVRAKTLQERGDYDQAIKIAKEALDEMVNEFRPGDLSVSHLEWSVLLMRELPARSSGATTLAIAVVAAYERLLGEGNPDTLAAKNEFGGVASGTRVGLD